jgi:hypothetical protein
MSFNLRIPAQIIATISHLDQQYQNPSLNASFTHGSDVPSARGIFSANPQALRSAPKPIEARTITLQTPPNHHSSSNSASSSASSTISGSSSAASSQITHFYSIPCREPTFAFTTITASSSSISAKTARTLDNLSQVRMPQAMNVPINSRAHLRAAPTRENLRREIALRNALTLTFLDTTSIPARIDPPISIDLIISKVPNDVLEETLIGFLSPKSFANFCMSKKDLYKNLNASPIWKRYIVQYFGSQAAGSKFNKQHWINIFGTHARISNLLGRRDTQRLLYFMPSLTRLPESTDNKEIKVIFIDQNGSKKI